MAHTKVSPEFPGHWRFPPPLRIFCTSAIILFSVIARVSSINSCVTPDSNDTKCETVFTVKYNYHKIINIQYNKIMHIQYNELENNVRIQSRTSIVFLKNRGQWTVQTILFDCVACATNPRLACEWRHR